MFGAKTLSAIETCREVKGICEISSNIEANASSVFQIKILTQIFHHTTSAISMLSTSKAFVVF